ncbi:MAG TPA: DUF2939 domain-containing protein, partial [Allosphingosinicella sp.]|nr:DUF2939 domain-containing protein [Allosphingosinicella sp.]
MRSTGRLLALACAALLLAAASWWLASPWWTLWRMRAAAEARDAGALSAYIDYGALRRSTRRQLKRKIGPVGGAVAGAAAGAAIRAETLRLLFLAGAGPKGGGAKPAQWRVTRHGLDGFTAAPAPAPAEGGKGSLEFR